MQAILNLGQLSYYISQLAVISRQFDISYDTGMGDIYTIEEFISILNQTQIQQSNLLLDYPSWSYCQSSDVITKDLIPYISIENPSKIMYTNLYEFTDKMIKNVIIM